MAEIVNLRMARKARDKARKASEAAENRAAFGRPKAAKILADKRNAIEVARIEAHRLENPDPE